MIARVCRWFAWLRYRCQKLTHVSDKAGFEECFYVDKKGRVVEHRRSWWSRRP